MWIWLSWLEVWSWIFILLLVIIRDFYLTFGIRAMVLWLGFRFNIYCLKWIKFYICIWWEKFISVFIGYLWFNPYGENLVDSIFIGYFWFNPFNIYCLKWIKFYIHIWWENLSPYSLGISDLIHMEKISKLHIYWTFMI